MCPGIPELHLSRACLPLPSKAGLRAAKWGIFQNLIPRLDGLSCDGKRNGDKDSLGFEVYVARSYDNLEAFINVHINIQKFLSSWQNIHPASIIRSWWAIWIIAWRKPKNIFRNYLAVSLSGASALLSRKGESPWQCSCLLLPNPVWITPAKWRDGWKTTIPSLRSWIKSLGIVKDIFPEY